MRTPHDRAQCHGGAIAQHGRTRRPVSPPDDRRCDPRSPTPSAPPRGGRHVEAASIADVGRALQLDTDRVVAVLTTGHRRLVAAVPWLSGDLRCSEARASLLAGTDRADDLQHVRSCAACRAADLIGLQSALADPAAWDGTWSSELRLRGSGTGTTGVCGRRADPLAPRDRRRRRLARRPQRPDEEAGASPVAEATLDGGDLAPGVTADVTAFADPAGVRIVLRAPTWPTRRPARTTRRG
ncbi:MAG: hypothetical protein R2713_04105 [Ilumatobacteraceae bacterium]